MSNEQTRNRLLVTYDSLEAYVAGGGGKGLARADDLGPDAIVTMLSASGLRGRGGAGFPTGTKWRSLLDATGERFLVANAAEGEPATFKDRLLLRRNPYQVLEGIAIAARTVGARSAYLGLKSSFVLEVESLQRAIDEMRAAGMLDGFTLEVIRGPDRYLLGEETGLLGVIEGRGPFPREIRPFMRGLFGSSSALNPTLVNNVETLANVPLILAEGPEWFRSRGTPSSPGTMLFTVAGDVVREGVHELALGSPLRELVEGRAGGMREGRAVKVIVPGASGAVMGPEALDIPLDFDELRRAGSSLGAGGFAVYDDSVCVLEVARAFTRFLHVESCAQCMACKLHSGVINELVTSLDAGSGNVGDLEEISARATKVTDGQKCALPTGTRAFVLSVSQMFADDFAAHVSGGCPSDRKIVLPKLIDFDEDAGRFLYDKHYETTSPQWTEEFAATSIFET